jgi:hypothetical protein
MDATRTPLTDPVALVRGLDPDAIREQIEAIDRERSALLVLLRAARRAHPEEAPRQRQEVSRAS